MFQSFEPLHFFTATNLNWLPLLRDDQNKFIILDSLQHMCMNRRCQIYGFVIMHNHIHLILDLYESKKEDFQRDFLKYTAQKCILRMKDRNDILLEKMLSTQKDRKLQFWERRPMWLLINSEETLVQKMHYIHSNPVNHKAIKCEKPDDYFWSSAASYSQDTPVFEFLTLIGLPETYRDDW